MYSTENIKYISKTRGTAKIARLMDVIETGAEPASVKEKMEIFKLRKVLSAMEKYGENRWWETSNLAILVKFQLAEPVLIVPIQNFLVALNVIFNTALKSEQELLEKLPELRKMALQLEG